MTNIALVVGSPYISGAEYVAYDIFNVLQTEFSTTKVIARQNFLTLNNIDDVHGITYKEELAPLKISEELLIFINYILIGLLSFKLLSEFDAYYCNDIEACFIVMPVAIFFNKKVIFHVHDIYKMNAKVKVLFTVLNLFVDNFVSLTSKNKERLKKITPKQITVINNCVSSSFKLIDLDLQEQSNTQKNKNSSLTLGFVGQIVTWKRPCKVLDFLLYLRDKGLNVNLKIAGSCFFEKEQDYTNNFLRKVEDMSDFVEYLGFIDREDMPTFYQSLDFLVSFSDNEPYGLVLIEALFCGLPIIALEGDGPYEIIKTKLHGTIISSFEDGYEYMVKSLDEPLSNSKLRSLYAAEKFSYKKFSRKIISMVKNTI